MRIHPLANDFVVVNESPDPQNIYVCSPGIVRLPDGRLVVTDGLRGPGVAELPGPKCLFQQTQPLQSQVFTSDDRGRTWTVRTKFGFRHARPFVAGDSTYVLGHDGDLMIMRSDDRAETWSEPARLTDGEYWHQAPSNVHYANGCVYLVMEKRVTREINSWCVGEMAPVLMRGRAGDDLTQRGSWSFATELSFREAVPGVEDDPSIDYFGVPFFDCPYPGGSMPAPGRHCAPMGWLETNVVQFTDPDHYWTDPAGRALHLWMRAHTGGTNYAAIAKVTEEGPTPGTGAMTTSLEKAPSGKSMLFVPCPGGQMKFHILFDEATALFWLLGTQATDSLTRADRLPPDRYNLPNNERRRLQLHFSKNCIDWCFAGLVAVGPVEQASRHYASMAFDGDDLHILSRSGDERAKNPHDGNLTTCHTIRDFRALAY